MSISVFYPCNQRGAFWVQIYPAVCTCTHLKTHIFQENKNIQNMHHPAHTKHSGGGGGGAPGNISNKPAAWMSNTFSNALISQMNE